MKILLANNHLPWENGYNLSIADGVCHWQPGGVNRGGDGHIFKLQSRHRRRTMKCSPLTKTNLSKWWKNSACGGHCGKGWTSTMWKHHILCTGDEQANVISLLWGWMLNTKWCQAKWPPSLFWYQACHTLWGLGCQPGTLGTPMGYHGRPEDIIGGVPCQLFTLLWPLAAPSFSPSRSSLTPDGKSRLLIRRHLIQFILLNDVVTIFITLKNSLIWQHGSSLCDLWVISECALSVALIM